MWGFTYPFAGFANAYRLFWLREQKAVSPKASWLESDAN